MQKKSLFFSSLIVMLLQACGGSGGGGGSDQGREEAIETALRQNTDYTILPTVAKFSVNAQALLQDVGAFCSNVSLDNLGNAQNSWKTLSEQWYKLALYNFGPLNDDVIFPAINFIDSMRERGTDYTATVRDEIVRQINGTQSLDSTYFNNLTFNKTGLLALELLLFEASHSENSQSQDDVLSDYENATRKCELLAGNTTLIVNRAKYVDDGWTTQFKDSDRSFRDIFVSGELNDSAEPVATLLVSVQFFLDYLHKRNVANKASQISGQTWANLSSSLDEVSQLLAGEDKTTISFFSLMQSAGLQSYIDDINANISAARSAVDEQDVTAFEDAVTKLDGNFKRELLDGLNVDPGINFTDGD